ncbi:recombinase family protein [Streptacidiphilus neutrinimicus]|uniref:recombinase family protein n=1 Tax=Streptacidiphilus neutrinimicus TaxID=105420 RepID=UPI0005A849E7|nr:recombinase family protein [Streptacidiphilus neutrinimicus]
MALRTPRRAGGRTELDIDPDDLSWILYARESEDAEGDGEQVENQMEDLVEQAQAVGGSIGRRVSENDTSAFKKRRVRLPDGTFAYRVIRPKWDSVLTDLRQGKHNALMVVNIDRGMRDPRDLEDLIDLVERHGVYVTALTGFLDLSTDAGIAMARNEVNQRNIESRNISRRISNGKRKAALKGRNSGGAYRPFGWNADKETLNLAEVEHLKKARLSLLSGKLPRTIVREWTERGVPTVTGAPWTVRSFEQIMTNPRLYGIKTYKGQILLSGDGTPVQGNWPSIFTEEEFTSVQPYLTSYERDAPRDARGHATKYLLSPFVRCGRCNARQKAGRRTAKDGGKEHYYSCRSKEEGGCGGCSRAGEPVDRYITELVIQDHERASLRAVEELPGWDRHEDLQAVRDKIRELTDQYRANAISGSRFFPLLQALEDDERALLAERKKIDSLRTRRMTAVADLRQKWKDPDFTLDQRQAAISESLIAVIIHPVGGGRRAFDPSKIEPVWRTQEEEDESGDDAPASKP